MSHIPEEVRRLVYERAFGRCEYCRLNELYSMKRHESDHIFAEKHGGETIEANLCLSCIDCNRFKGSDLCSIDLVSGEIVTLFHPRFQDWNDHFRLSGAYIEGLTP